MVFGWRPNQKTISVQSRRQRTRFLWNDAASSNQKIRASRMLFWVAVLFCLLLVLGHGSYYSYSKKLPERLDNSNPMFSSTSTEKSTKGSYFSSPPPPYTFRSSDKNPSFQWHVPLTSTLTTTPQKVKAPILLFFHVPKAAGTTVTKQVIANRGVHHPNNKAAGEQQPIIKVDKLAPWWHTIGKHTKKLDFEHAAVIGDSWPTVNQTIFEWTEPRHPSDDSQHKPKFVEFHGDHPTFVDLLQHSDDSHISNSKYARHTQHLLLTWKQRAHAAGIPLFTFTVLRKPVDLQFSTFSYFCGHLKRYTKDVCHGAPLSFEGLQQVSPSNPQALWLCRSTITLTNQYAQLECPELIEQLAAHMDWVGVQDDLATTMQVLNEVVLHSIPHFSADKVLNRQPAAKKTEQAVLRPSDVPAQELEDYRQRHLSLDEELYQWAKGHYPKLYANRLRQAS